MSTIPTQRIYEGYLCLRVFFVRRVGFSIVGWRVGLRVAYVDFVLSSNVQEKSQMIS